MKDLRQIEIKRADGSLNVMTINDEPSLTQQQFKDECDINNIMAKYQKTGEFTHAISKQGQYADFSDIHDYREMVHTVLYADEAFAKLPALVRAKFKNNPAELLDFLQDPKNKDEAIKLGLANPPAPKAPNETNPKTNDPASSTPPKA